MATTIVAGQTSGQMVKAGNLFTVTVGAIGTVVVQRIQSGVELEKFGFTAAQSRIFGEYNSDMEFVVTCMTGSVTMTESTDTAAWQVRATQTNDDAAAGAIGEYKTGTVLVASEVTLTTATAKTVVSLSLTAGDWDVSGIVQFDLAGATTTIWECSISSTADTLGVANSEPIVQTTVTNIFCKAAPVTRITLAATTTIYLVAKATFSAGTVKAYGDIRARRVR